MKLFGIFAFAAVAMAELDYDSIGLKKAKQLCCRQGTKRMQRSQAFRLHGQVQIVEVYFKKPRQQKPTFDQENATVTSFPTPWTSPNCGSVLQETQTTKTH